MQVDTSDFNIISSSYLEIIRELKQGKRGQISLTLELKQAIMGLIEKNMAQLGPTREIDMLTCLCFFSDKADPELGIKLSNLLSHANDLSSEQHVALRECLSKHVLGPCMRESSSLPETFQLKLNQALVEIKSDKLLDLLDLIDQLGPLAFYFKKALKQRIPKRPYQYFGQGKLINYKIKQILGKLPFGGSDER